MGPPHARNRRSALVAVLLTIGLGTTLGAACAWADDPLPVIVTYEMQHRQEAARAAQSNPKAFWTSQILSRIEARRTASPQKLASTAVVQIRFTVARDGHLVRSAIDRSSGLPALDQVAAGMVARAEPFPPMPGQLADSELTFVLPVRFR